MRKTYRYKNLSFEIGDDADVYLSVEFISDGNMGQTLIDVPGTLDPEIENSGTAFIGKGKDLRSDSTICFSDIVSLIPEEDEIRIQYKINGQLLIEHTNQKSEEKRPIINLYIKFPII
jgi:hypothetical protein